MYNVYASEKIGQHNKQHLIMSNVEKLGDAKRWANMFALERNMRFNVTKISSDKRHSERVVFEALSKDEIIKQERKNNKDRRRRVVKSPSITGQKPINQDKPRTYAFGELNFTGRP